jgi:hypothetical protein
MNNLKHFLLTGLYHGVIFARWATINFSRSISFFACNLCQAGNDTAKVYVTSLYEEKEFYEVDVLRRDNFHQTACCTSETVERIYMKLCSKRYTRNCKKDLIFASYELKTSSVV